MAKPSVGFLSEAIVKKFLVAMLTIAALSGAVLVNNSGPAAAWRGGNGGAGTPTKCAPSGRKLDRSAGRPEHRLNSASLLR